MEWKSGLASAGFRGVLGFALLLARVGDAASARLPAGVEAVAYGGWAQAFQVRDDSGRFRVVVVPEVGGRVLNYSRNGQGLLLENPASAGKTLANSAAPFWLGGYHCDVGPELRGSPPRQLLSLGPHQWRTPRDFTIETASPTEPALGVRLVKSVTLDPDDGSLGLVQRLVNVSAQDLRHALWDRTLCVGGGFVFFERPKQSRFPARWSIRQGSSAQALYDGQSPAAANVRLLEDLLVAHADESSGKIGTDTDTGWIAYVRGRLLFVKYFPFFPLADYTEGGNSLTFSWGGGAVELHALSPTVTLRPGDHYDFPEYWTLSELKNEVTTFEAVRAVARKIPPSPFAPKK